MREHPVRHLLVVLSAAALLLALATTAAGATSTCTVGPQAQCAGANLAGHAMRGKDMRGANMNGARMRGMDLRGTDLRGASMLGADMRGVDLRGAKLLGARFDGANLRGADLTGVRIGSTRFDKPRRVLAPSTRDDWCTNGGGTWMALSLGPNTSATYVYCASASFDGAFLDNAAMGGLRCFSCNFNNAQLDYANAVNAVLHGSTFVNARLSNVDFTGADLTSTRQGGAHGGGAFYTTFTNVHFDYANLCGDGTSASAKSFWVGNSIGVNTTLGRNTITCGSFDFANDPVTVAKHQGLVPW